jgi:outer membrane lipoprotein LolB
MISSVRKPAAFNPVRLIALNLIGLVILTIGGCATRSGISIEAEQTIRDKQARAISTWQVKGRISIKSPEQSFVGNLSWQQGTDEQLFRLYGSLGQTYAELTQTAQDARLELSDERVFESTDVDSLMLENLGYRLPIKQLYYWIRGLAPSEQTKVSRDEDGLISDIRHQRWQITYRSYRKAEAFNDLELPSRITVTDGEHTIKLSLRDWQPYQ